MNEPAKPWRVHAGNGFSTDHRSMIMAFEQVKMVHQWGMTALVYRWSDGDWRFYQELEPPANKSTADSWPF
jgi:hypothetical protein